MTPEQNARQLRNLRRNLERSAQTNTREQQLCPESQTDKRRGHDTHRNPDEAIGGNFDQKLYMFPPHYNFLREELVNNWQDSLWPLVAYRMAFKSEEFCEYMNAATGLALTVDSDAVDWTCEMYLKELRKMRGA